MVDELDDAGVADVLVDDDPSLATFDTELLVPLLPELVLVAEAPPTGVAAMTPTRPANVTPVRAVATRRARAAGWRRRGPGRPAEGGGRPGGRGGGGTLDAGTAAPRSGAVEGQDPR